MYAISKNPDEAGVVLKRYSVKQKALILTRPECLSPDKQAIRSDILKSVHLNQWWLKCDCCNNPSTILFIRKNKNIYTVCRNGESLEHSPLCPVRNWTSSESTGLSDKSKGLFRQIQANTQLGRISITDYENTRLSSQYSSIRCYANNIKIKDGAIKMITHQDAFLGIGKFHETHPDTQLYAMLVTDKLERYRINLKKGFHIDCPVIKAEGVDPKSKIWSVVVEFDQNAEAVEAYAHPIISKADLVAVASANEYFLIKTLRSLIKYWATKSTVRVEALRTYRNDVPAWCLYMLDDNQGRTFFADVVLLQQESNEGLEGILGKSTYIIPDIKDESFHGHLNELRKPLTRMFFKSQRKT